MCVNISDYIIKGLKGGGGVFNILLYNVFRLIYIGCNVKIVSFGLNFVVFIFNVYLKFC